MPVLRCMPLLSADSGGEKRFRFFLDTRSITLASKFYWNCSWKRWDFIMMALFKSCQKFFLPALLLVGLSPFVLNHWNSNRGFAAAGFTLQTCPDSSHQGTPPEGTARHKVCWKAEDNTTRSLKVFIPMDSLGPGTPLAFLSGKTPIPTLSNLSCRIPEVLSVLRI